MNYNMTVILYADVTRKGKLKGDVGAEEPSDLCVILDCVETKEQKLWQISNLQCQKKIFVIL